MAPSAAPKRTNESSTSNARGDSNNVKKRRLEPTASGQTRGDRIAKLTQQKSSFEGDLEKLTQGLTELKGGLFVLRDTPMDIRAYAVVDIQSMRKQISTGIELHLLISNLVEIS